MDRNRSRRVSTGVERLLLRANPDHTTRFRLLLPNLVALMETAQKRAQAEQFSFDVDALGLFQVINESYENPATHQYTVSIDD